MTFGKTVNVVYWMNVFVQFVGIICDAVTSCFSTIKRQKILFQQKYKTAVSWTCNNLRQQPNKRCKKKSTMKFFWHTWTDTVINDIKWLTIKYRTIKGKNHWKKEDSDNGLLISDRYSADDIRHSDWNN